MEKKEYLVGVTVIEARKLRAKDQTSGTSDPFVKITCGNSAPQVTQKRFSTNAVVWNQSFTFPGLMMNQYELETFELILEVFDYNSVFKNALIGQFSIGLSTMYRNLNHEFYRQWLTLYNPELQNNSEVQGYLQVSCFIVGSSDRPPGHSNDDKIEDEEQITEEMFQGMSEQQKLEIQSKKKGLFLLNNPDMFRKGYQLSVSILKAEGLPQIAANSADSFMSVRASGYVQITRVITQNLNPQFNARLCFPVYLPIYNDKITIRLWHQNPPGFRKEPDVFIGNIPEFPSAYDPFNISKLLINEGKMRATWFNIYGAHPNDRTKIVKGEKKEGSQFMGRVLIAMLLVPHEKPYMYAAIANPMKEPASEKYRLWIDVYDLVNCDSGKDKQLWVKGSMGSFETDKCFSSYKKKSDTFWWPQISLPDLEVNFTIDIRQTPDIFIYIGVKDKEILGYIRIPAKDCQRNQPSPQWYRLKSMTTDKFCPGIILINIQYVWDSNSDRFPKQRSVEAPYKFFAQIISGFEIAPNIPIKDLSVKVDMKIGNLSVNKKDNQKKTCTEVQRNTRYPQWNQIFELDIMMDKNISFAPDMRVMIQREPSGMFDSNVSIGDFFVPVKSIAKQLYTKPQYFNIISNEGKLQGQILARFFVQQMNNKTQTLEEFQKVRNELNSMGTKCFTVDIKISVFGIRNLFRDARSCSLSFKLSAVNQQPITVKQKETVDGATTKNPNFGEIVEFKKVQLSFEPLLWPLLEVEITDQRNFLNAGGCENCYTTIPLFDFATKILTEKQRIFTKAQLNKNQNSLKLVQKQINPNKFYRRYLKKMSRPADEDDGHNLSADSDDSQDEKNNLGFQMAGGQRVKEMENDLEVFQFDDYSDDDGGAGKRKQTKKVAQQIEETVDTKDIKLSLKKSKSKIPVDDGFSSEEEEKQEQPKKRQPVLGETVGVLGNLDGANIEVKNIIFGNKTQEIKEDQDNIRNDKIRELDEKIDQQTELIQRTKNKDLVDKLKAELFDMKNKIQYLQDEEMDEDKFWGYALDDGGQGGFQYGRDIIKEGTFESTQLKMPYQEFPLLSTENAFKKNTAQVGGMLRSGYLTGATLKACIKLEESFAPDFDSDEEEESEAKNATPVNPQDEGETPGGPEQGEELDDENNEENTLTLIQRKFPFDITQSVFLGNLLKQSTSFKVRVYILSCQNLAATGSEIDLKDRLAGLQALCSANAYPVIQVGDGLNNPGQQKIKIMSFRDKQVNQDLNPKFYLSYELDATFPDDWRLEIIIKDKSSFDILGDRLDSVIGSTVIDLENRLQGNFRRQTIDALQIYKDQINTILRNESRKEKPDNTLKKEKEMLKVEITKHQQHLMNKIAEKPVPVEFRDLINKDKNQAQGIVEMWVEVLTKEEARKIPMSRLQQERKDEYEIRLIIWETRDVPIVNGNTTDIFVKVQFDPTGWSGGQIEKSTDTHYGSKDGRCVFNYRFKFDISTPCEFPRLKFQMYDFGMMNDEALGESILNLKKTMGLLAKEEKIDIPKTWLSFNSPNDKLDDVGQLLISMQILNKADAEMSPVGEAQEEPNENPKLEKPTEGRGMGDRILAATNIDLSNLSLPKINFFRNFIIIGIVFGVVVLVLIVIMFLK